MGERVYVVREGKVRGEGRYRAPGIPAWTGGRWAPTIKDAFRFTSRSMAMRNARKCKGRPVRLVTIPEQLRRAKKRIAELVSKQACMTDKAVQIMKEDRDEYYQRGRADERAAVVAKLRDNGPHGFFGATRTEVADYFESGEHVKEHKR